MRALQFLRALEREHEVHMLSPEPPPGAPAPPPGVQVTHYRRGSGWARGAAAFLAGRPAQAGLYDSSDLEHALAEISSRVDLVVLQLARLAERRRVLDAPVYVDLVDCLSLNFRRRARFDRRVLRPALREEARRLARAERRILEDAAGACVVCERDRAALLGGPPDSPTGRLDVIRLPMAEHPRSIPRDEARPILALTGNLGYFVNADAASWWIDEVWGQVRAARPEARLVVAGDRAGSSLRRRIERAGGELVPSPERLLDEVERATVALAPMRCGSGVPVKVLEAWACGTPVVATRYAADGAAAEDGRELLIAESVDEWVEAITQLVRDPVVAQERAREAREALRVRHDEETIAMQLLESVQRAAGAA